MKLTLGFSPCPNDTFIFYALLHNKVKSTSLQFTPVIEDVETLNQKSLRAELDITKLSFATYAIVTDQYSLLKSGSALGRNCGPLVISKIPVSKEEIVQCNVAIPGIHTTACFLFRKFFPDNPPGIPMHFSEIESAVRNGQTDLGVIIHENRFTYEQKGLKKVADLGELWERSTGYPIPLGGIAMKKSFPEDVAKEVESLIRRSLQYAWKHEDETMQFVKKYAAEMDEVTMKKHIALYVNSFTDDLGDEGHAALKHFLNLFPSIRSV